MGNQSRTATIEDDGEAQKGQSRVGPRSHGDDGAEYHLVRCVGQLVVNLHVGYHHLRLRLAAALQILQYKTSQNEAHPLLWGVVHH